VREGSTPGVFEAVSRFRWTSLLIVVIVTVLSAGVGFALGRGVTASAQIVLRTPGTSDVVGVVATTESTFVRYVAQRAIFATSEPVLSAAAGKLAGTTVDDLRHEVTAVADLSGHSITVTATAGSADAAARIANTMVTAYQSQSREQVQQASTSALAALNAQRRQVVAAAKGGGTIETSSASQTVSDLDQRVSEIGVAASVFGSGVSFVDQADPAAAVSHRLPLRETAAGLVLGALLAATVAWLRADRDRRVVDPEAVAELIDAPLLGEIERAGPAALAALSRPDRMPFGEYRLVASALITMGAGVVVVAGADPREGRTTTAAQIAVAAARQGLRVLLVDACPAGTGVSALFGQSLAEASERASLLTGRPLPAAAGLAGVAAEPLLLDPSIVPVDIGGGARLDLLPAGSQARPFPSTAALDGLVGVLRARYDLVLVDTPPLGTGGSDVAPVVGRADRVVLVVRRGARVAGVRRLVEQAELLGATVAGAVVTFLPPVESSESALPSRELATT